MVSRINLEIFLWEFEVKVVAEAVAMVLLNMVVAVIFVGGNGDGGLDNWVGFC